MLCFIWHFLVKPVSYSNSKISHRKGHNLHVTTDTQIFTEPDLAIRCDLHCITVSTCSVSSQLFRAPKIGMEAGTSIDERHEEQLQFCCHATICYYRHISCRTYTDGYGNSNIYFRFFIWHLLEIQDKLTLRKYVLYSVQCSVQYVLYSVQCTVCTVQSVLITYILNQVFR